MSALKPFAAFLGFIVIVLFLRAFPYTSSLFHDGEASLSRMGAFFGRAFTRFVASEDSLAVRLTSCEEDRGILGREAVEYARLVKENEELRGIVKYTEENDRPGVTARVIARSLPEEQSRVVVDKGESSGVTEGSAVIVGQGIVFGIVTKVGANSSIVTLLTSSDSSVPAAILGKRKTIGLLEGRDGAVLSMEFVPREAGVTKGEIVVTSGLEGQIPEGLLLGTVTTVVDMESAPFAEALVEPLQDPLSSSMVLILPNVGTEL